MHTMHIIHECQIWLMIALYVQLFVTVNWLERCWIRTLSGNCFREKKYTFNGLIKSNIKFRPNLEIKKKVICGPNTELTGKTPQIESLIMKICHNYGIHYRKYGQFSVDTPKHNFYYIRSYSTQVRFYILIFLVFHGSEQLIWISPVLRNDNLIEIWFLWSYGNMPAAIGFTFYEGNALLG